MSRLKEVGEAGTDSGQYIGLKNATSRQINWDGGKKVRRSVSFDPDLLAHLNHTAKKLKVSLSYYLNGVLRSRSAKAQYIPVRLTAREAKVFLALLLRLKRWIGR